MITLLDAVETFLAGLSETSPLPNERRRAIARALCQSIEYVARGDWEAYVEQICSDSLAQIADELYAAIGGPKGLNCAGSCIADGPCVCSPAYRAIDALRRLAKANKKGPVAGAS